MLKRNKYKKNKNCENKKNRRVRILKMYFGELLILPKTDKNFQKRQKRLLLYIVRKFRGGCQKAEC